MTAVPAAPSAPERVPGQGDAERIRRVGVVGGGAMGAGIAEVCAAAGHAVLVAVTSPASGVSARQRLVRALERRLTRGGISSDYRDRVLAGVGFTTELGELNGSDLVVEAIREREADKREMFALLDKMVGGQAILASTTSAVPISRLAQVVTRPGQVVGMHFFNPVPAQRLVEVIPSLLTDGATVATVEAFVRDALGKTPVRAPDRPGFVVNALLIPYLLAAIRMVEAGFASAQDVDTAMTLGCSHPLGPLRLADLIGLDVVASVAEVLYTEFKDPAYASPPLLLRCVEVGLLGKKTGRGFYDYAPG